MALKIEDYALIGDTHTAGLVGKDGSIDWLCLPRFDSGACFAALLGDASNGRWLVAPKGHVRSVSRRYEPNTLVLVTEFTTDAGVVEVRDCMTPRDKTPNLVRLVRCVRGHVEMTMELVIRFEYGSVVPWVTRSDGLLTAVAGPDALSLRTPVPTQGKDLTTSPPNRSMPRSRWRRRSTGGKSGRPNARTQAAGATKSCARSSR